MGKLVKWLIDERVRLMRHFTGEKHACTPSIEWWIVVAVIYPLVQRVEATFISVQDMNTLLCASKKNNFRGFFVICKCKQMLRAP
jgi:hypothetical protein